MDKFKKGTHSWFWKLFLNNQIVTGLLIVLLCLLITYVFTKVSYLFAPVFQFVGIIAAPVIFAGILYYLLNPVVDYLERKNVGRSWSILIIFTLIVALIVWGIVIVVPEVQSQITRFVENWPSYWQTIQDKGNELLTHPFLKEYAGQIEQVVSNVSNSMGTLVKNVSKNTFQGIGSVIGVVSSVVLTVATGPIILFYLLRDGKNLGGYIEGFLPIKARKSVMTLLNDINNQVSQYIRGQLTVAFVVAIMFMVGFKAIHLDFAVTLGVIAGFLNLVPYLGSFLAMIPAIILGVVAGPSMLVKVLIVFALEQFIEGRFVSPIILGSQLEIHPVTIIFVLLTSGKLFGVAGVILGVPGYAAIKVIVTHVFEWYKEKSGLYEDSEDTVKKAPPDV